MYFNTERVELLGECDGAFLIVDTAKHVGTTHSDKEVQKDLREHVKDCEICQNTMLMEGAFSR